MIHGKKGIGIGPVFIFIISVLTFSLIMIFGYKAVTDFMASGEEVQFYQFKTSLESAIKKIYTEHGSVRIREFQAPPNYHQICFVNLDFPGDKSGTALCSSGEEDESYDFYDPLACNAWKDAENYQQADQNVFLKPQAVIKIKVHNIDMDDGFLCRKIVNGEFTLGLEGKGDRTYLFVPLE